MQKDRWTGMMVVKTVRSGGAPKKDLGLMTATHGVALSLRSIRAHQFARRSINKIFCLLHLA
jgi:hypothetical protein